MIKKKKTNQILSCPARPPIILSNKLITYSRGYLEQSGAPESVYLNVFPFQSPCFRSRLSFPSHKVNRCDFKHLLQELLFRKKNRAVWMFFLSSPHLGHKIQKLVHFWSYPVRASYYLPFNILSHRFLDEWVFLHK